MGEPVECRCDRRNVAKINVSTWNFKKCNANVIEHYQLSLKICVAVDLSQSVLGPFHPEAEGITSFRSVGNFSQSTQDNIPRRLQSSCSYHSVELLLKLSKLNTMDKV